jgi:hypothetical protein
VKKLIKLENIPYSPGLAPDEFCLFFQLKSTMKGRRFCDATDIVINAKEQLKRFFYKIASRNVKNNFTVAGRIV